MWWLHVIGAKLGAAVDWIIGLVLELVEEVRGIVVEDRPPPLRFPGVYEG